MEQFKLQLELTSTFNGTTKEIIGVYDKMEEVYDALRKAVIPRYMREVYYNRYVVVDENDTIVIDFGSHAHFGRIKRVYE